MADFNLKTWAKKWLYGAGAAIATTAVIYTANYLQATTFPPQYALAASVVTVILVNVGNALKHLSTPATPPTTPS